MTIPSENHDSDLPVQYVFSICASTDVVSAGNDACAEVPGTSFMGEFHDYFTGERRPQFPQSLKAAFGSVALVDCDRDPKLALATMDRLRMMGLKNLSIVAFATQIDTTYLLNAMRAGCNEFLTKPAETPALRSALIRFQHAHIADGGGQRATGRILSFFGSKGGVGTTTLAVHLASALVRRHRKRTLLIDYHHELGHVALYLGLRNAQYHFDELVHNADRLDADLLKGFVAKHSSGLEVLASPDGYGIDHKSTPEQLQLVLDFLRTQYDYVLIDSSMRYKLVAPWIVRGSDEVYLVSSPDVAALRDLARHVEHLSQDEGQTAKLRLIINRSTSDDAASAEQIEAAVRSPVALAISNNYSELIRALNAGEPIPVQHRSAFAQQMSKWADRLIAAEVAPGEQSTAIRKRFSLWGLKSARAS